MSNAHLFVMAGGSGTRFWPKSTSRTPKQILSFEGEGSPTLLAKTLERFEGIVPASQRWIVTTEQLSAEVAKIAPEVRILGEPQARNTAPAVYWAARALAAIDPKAVMLVMPSDHHIADLPAFRATVVRAIEWARLRDDLVTLGVRPTRPETGYGYLKLGREIERGRPAVSVVERFVEKPNQERAEEFVASGEYLWNGGMFVWRVESILKAFDALMPEMKREWDALGGNPLAAYPKLTATSIDYGVMEKAKNVVTLALDCGWDDLGSWTSLETLALSLGLAREGGVLTGGNLVAVESAGNIVDAPGSTVALLGVDNLIVAKNGDAILVARKDRAQDIRLVVEAIKKAKPELA